MNCTSARKIASSNLCPSYSCRGCVAVDTDGGSLGAPLNEKGGGVFVLEWDPVYRHIRTWVFTPHLEVPENLAQAIRTAKEPVLENRVMPDPDEWPLPYGYFPLGKIGVVW